MIAAIELWLVQLCATPFEIEDGRSLLTPFCPTLRSSCDRKNVVRLLSHIAWTTDLQMPRWYRGRQTVTVCGVLRDLLQLLGTGRRTCIS